MRRFGLLVLLFFVCGCGTLSVSDLPVNPNIRTGTFAGTAVGAFVDGLSSLSSFEASTGKNLAVVLWYVPWTSPFPANDAAAVSANGSVPLITWEPAIPNSTGTLEAISSGSYEAYVRSFLQAAKDYGKPVFLRFAHEMNGDWYAWAGAHNGNDATAPAKYINAWIYIYNVRQAVGANNVYLVWCPNNTNHPGDAWNNIAAYYPGDQYVDWVGMDGYNWGGTANTSWQSFDDVFQKTYSDLKALTAKPLMIGEFACAEQGGDKAGWISDALLKIRTAYPRVKIFCWFNIWKERDWRTNSSASAETAFRNSLQNPYYLARIDQVK